jgi:hypothetical protein
MMSHHVMMSWFRWWHWGWAEGWLALAAFAIIHFAFAAYTLLDARRRGRLFLQAPSGLWALLVLVTGVVGVAVYWLVNASSLAVSSPAEPTHKTEPRVPPVA